MTKKRKAPWCKVDGKPVPVVWDGEVIRFAGNRIVRVLLDAARDGTKLDMNDIVRMYYQRLFTQDEMVGFCQLIGYSIAGFLDLSYAENVAIEYGP